MRRTIQKAGLVTSIIALSSIFTSGLAFAHVVVSPSEAATGSFENFSLGVPTEKTMPTVSVKLLIPTNLQSVTPTIKAGWNITEEKTGAGEQAVVKSITWSGGSIPAGYRDDFTFSGKVPIKTGELDWKAYQTYSDGSIVSWDQVEKSGAPDNDSASSGPFSTTKIVTATAVDGRISNAADTAEIAHNTATQAKYIAIAGLAIGLAALYRVTREPKQ